jgi:multiple antibiotic resistance protein
MNSHDSITFGIIAFTSFFTLINPLGVMPIFMTMTADIDRQHRIKTAQKASFAAFITLLLFAFGGQYIFSFFGITANSFRVVGGIIFFLMGMDMLQARLSKVKVRESEVKSYVTDISITPLAIPMLSGPGSMTNAIIMMEEAKTTELKFALVTAIFLVMAITFIVLLSSSKIIKMLGQTGNNVLMRLMGLIVMVIAVEFFFSGMKPILSDIINQ